MLERTYIQARQVARTRGIKTGTLCKWRRQGRGPKGWVRLSRTSLAYPAQEVVFGGGLRPEGEAVVSLTPKNQRRRSTASRRLDLDLG
jgi:transposase-like protein